VQLTDGDGGTSSVVSKQIAVVAVNDKPTLGGIAGSVHYVHDAAGILLADTATVTDVDSTNFYGGEVRVLISRGASSSNRLSVGGSFVVDAGGYVKLGHTIIGTLIATNKNELVVRFRSAATPVVVQQLLRSITFKTVGGLAGMRNMEFTVSDGDGGLSAKSTMTVNVT